MNAFCKLLDDASTYERDNGQAAALRKDVFSRSAAMHPLVICASRIHANQETRCKESIAVQLGMPWNEIEGRLFADIPEFQRLETFAGYESAQALLARYNVVQIQATLFRAVEMVIWAADDFKNILRHAKLSGLMHSVRRVGRDAFEIRLDGPASVLRATRRYGVAMARFLPSLIACRDWRMHAVLQTPRRGWLVSLDLSSRDRLNSHLPAPNEFDSRVEADFAQAWGNQREGWSLQREAEILNAGQKVFIPDFALTHEDGRRVLLEIVGFWTPEYLEAKLKTLGTFQKHRILVAVGQSARKHDIQLPPGVIHFKTRLRPEEVLRRLEA
jgi:predicted nuclease of restriction endonuclease-like RecB superfamily